MRIEVRGSCIGVKSFVNSEASSIYSTRIYIFLLVFRIALKSSFSSNTIMLTYSLTLYICLV